MASVAAPAAENVHGGTAFDFDALDEAENAHAAPAAQAPMPNETT